MTSMQQGGNGMKRLTIASVRTTVGAPGVPGGMKAGTVVVDVKAGAFPSLTFPADRTVISVVELAGRLRVSKQHVTNLIEEGKLRALDIGATNGTGRRRYRIPVESWEAYVRKHLM